MITILRVAVPLGLLMGCTGSDRAILPLTVSSADQPACFSARPIVRRSTNLMGRIAFSTEQNTYMISYSVPGTYDSVWKGYVCNLPDEYKVPKKQVVFSGEYREAPEIRGVFGGEENYYLYLTAIK